MKNKKKALFFSPFAGIWPHSLAERRLIDQLEKLDVEIHVVGCNKLFNEHCTVMESWKIELDANSKIKEKCCSRCIFASKLLFGKKENFFYLNDFISETQIETHRSNIKNLTSQELRNLKYNNIEIGTHALYETLLKFKQINTDFIDEKLEFYRNSVLNSLLVAEAASNFIKQKEFDFAFIYSPQYGVNNTFASTIEAKVKKTFLIEASPNLNESYSALRIWNWHKFGLVNPALFAWENFKEYSFEKEIESRAVAHYSELWAGKTFTYSSRKTVNSPLNLILGIPEGRKIWLLALSSFDESFAAYSIGAFPKEKFESDVFENQFEWVKATVDWFAINKPINTSLVIRLHPRDLPNRREKIESQQYGIWTGILKNLPSNVHVDFPHQKISFFEYLSQINLLLTGWSSTALDALLNNVQVITYDSRIPSFPKDIHVTGRSKKEYFDNLKDFQNDKFENVELARTKKWISLNFAFGTFRHPGRIQDLQNIKRFYLLHFILRGMAVFMYQIVYRLDLNFARRPKSETSKINNLLNGSDDLFMLDLHSRN
jgi:hypothetical protein